MTSRQHEAVTSTMAETFSSEPFSNVSSNEWYGYDDEDISTRALRLDAKQAFLSDDTLSFPNLTYPRLDVLDYDRIERAYQDMLSESQRENDDDSYSLVARKLAELYRHKEISRRIGWTANEALSRERASTMTLELFGEPDKEDFAHLLSALRDKAASLAAVTPLAEQLLELTGSTRPETPQPSYELSDSTLEVLREDLFELFPGLKEHIATVPDSGADTSTKATYMQGVAQLVTGDERQQIRVIKGAKAAESSRDNLEVTIGVERLEAMSSTQLVKTSVHEVIGHLFRAINARQQSDPSLRLAQAGNLKFEEGFATAIEQIITGEKRIAGVQYYLSLGLQLGLDRNGEKRDFRETFEILWRRQVIENLANGKEPDEQDARHKAYVQCLRTTRGGSLDARDISYLEGSKLLYPWLNELAEQPAEQRMKTLRTVLSGNFDATNDEQMQRYQQGDVK